jgi:hypothetical protein
MRDTLEKEKRKIQDLENRLTKQKEVGVTETRGPLLLQACWALQPGFRSSSCSPLAVGCLPSLWLDAPT